MFETIAILIYLVILSIYDCREKAVPVLHLFAGGTVILAVVVYRSVFFEGSGLQFAAGLLPAMIPGVILLFAVWITKKAGYADGVVLLVVGIALGYREGMLLFCISLILISLFSGGMLLFGRGNGNTRIPYIPFIAIAYVVCITL